MANFSKANKERILVGIAWPYVNGEPHVGHLAGAILPADIFARFHRMIGNEVIMVSGSDMHGTPTALLALDQGVAPEKIAFHYHAIWADCLRRMHFQYDLYTHTHTENHARVSRDIFARLWERGYIYPKTQKLPYSETEGIFLPDRLVEGTCPHCGSERARGDQCDQCGRTLDPADLIDIRSKRDGSVPVFKESKHLFLKLTAFKEQLERWLADKEDEWRKNVYRQTLSIVNTLEDRAVTRDLSWGIPAPVPGFEDKSIYVWFEAVIGYLSASVEWAARRGTPDAWRAFWEGDAKTYYFQGKDNIPFHAVIWPAMLFGYGELNPPTEVVANEFVNQGDKLSKSSGNAVWVKEYLERYDPEPLRYYLTAIMPETSDSEFTWEGFFNANNNELVATYGNFVNRAFAIAARHFDNRVPAERDLNALDVAMAAECRRALDEVGAALNAKRFREALKAAMGLARKGNQYMEQKQPWKTVKSDPQAAANAIAVALRTIDALKVVFYPFLPESSGRLHAMLGLSGDALEQGWTQARIDAGHPLGEARILFNKLDAAAFEAEHSPRDD